MKRAPLWKISITTTPEAEDAVAELLSATFGPPASAYTDSETGISTVTVYLQQKPKGLPQGREDILTGLKRIQRCGLRIGSGKIAIVKMRHEDWAESWKRHFPPIEIGFKSRRDELRESPSRRRKSGTRITRPSEALAKSLLIKPSWSKRKAREDQAVIVLDPGLSFGTGQHPTTSFCLQQIVRLCKRRFGTHHFPEAAARRPYHKQPSFLDLGTGSGILAIAAAKLGYSPVVAMDFDPEAVRVARANACANRVEPKLQIERRDMSKLPIRPRQRGQGYDLICANLTSDLLIAQRRRIVAQLKRSGKLVLAGVLKTEFAVVQRAYKALGLSLVAHRKERGWCSGSFCFVDYGFFEQRNPDAGLI
jgi:ribosomal protein L11 methyltransferase